MLGSTLNMQIRHVDSKTKEVMMMMMWYFSPVRLESDAAVRSEEQPFPSYKVEYLSQRMTRYGKSGSHTVG